MHEQTRWFGRKEPARRDARRLGIWIGNAIRIGMAMMTVSLTVDAQAASAATHAAPAASGVSTGQTGTSSQGVRAPADRVAVPLYPGAVPDAAGTTAADLPTLTLYRPASPAPTGTAIIVCPGGGYARLADDHEGKQVAEWLNSLGVTAFVLHYRLGPRYHHPVMLHDAQRAIRQVRALAPALQLRADRIGIMGFSAGGHLASTTATHFDEGQPSAADAVEREGSRPDFVILGYPVITLTDPYAHKGSRTNLLGPTPDPALVDLLSNEKQVTARTPPTFLFHTDDDPGVPVQNSLLFFDALKKSGVPAELHVYAHGKHGVGLAQSDPVLSSWPARLADWLKVRELLP